MKAVILIFLMLVPALSHAQIGAKIKSASEKSMEGTWINNEFGYSMVLQLNADGSGEFDGDRIQYKVNGNQFILINAGITTNYQYAIRENKLILSGGDLEKPVIFTRPGNTTGDSKEVRKGNEESTKDQNSLIGKWENSSESLDFHDDGTVIIQGITMSYSIAGNQLTIQGLNGTQTFTYSLQPGYLTINIKGTSEIYKKAGAQVNLPTGQAYSKEQNGMPAGQGIIAPELVGKWCYMNVSSTGTGGWSTDECIVINADGTYEYNYESSGSASGYNQYGDQTFAGGTGSQFSDRGTWRLAGNTLYVNSQSKGQQVLTLQKVNNPKNGDPMIVIDGRAYVTYYQRPGW